MITRRVRGIPDDYQPKGHFLVQYADYTFLIKGLVEEGRNLSTLLDLFVYFLGLQICALWTAPRKGVKILKGFGKIDWVSTYEVFGPTTEEGLDVKHKQAINHSECRKMTKKGMASYGVVKRGAASVAEINTCYDSHNSTLNLQVADENWKETRRFDMAISVERIPGQGKVVAAKGLLG